MKSIIFNSQEIQALQRGKTMFRVPVKPQPEIETGYDYPHENETGYFWKKEESYDSFEEMIADIVENAPYKVGDRIFVKETFRVAAWRDADSEKQDRMAFDYKASPEVVSTPWCFPPISQWRKMAKESRVEAKNAYLKDSSKCWFDGEVYGWERGDSPCRWRSPVYMPQWASRYTLGITGVKVERVQDISNGDILDQGIGPQSPDGTDELQKSLKDQWKYFWIAKHGQKSWDINPWVFAYTFKEVKNG